MQNATITQIKNFFIPHTNIEAVILHGSYAKGTAKPTSDIDIGLLLQAETTMTSVEKAQLAAELSYQLEKDIDIGEISSKNLIYAKEVLVNGVPIYIKNQNYFEFMRMTLLSMYLRFNEDRQEVVHAWHS